MGKRTHSSTGSTYYQCDWTAHPLDRPTCQFPVWKVGSENGEGKEERLTKVGSFLNNECVMAKAYKMCRDGELDEAGLDRVLGHLEERTGVSMQATEEALSEIDPKVLIHFGGTYSLGHFKQRCEEMTREEMVTAILIPDDKSMPVREVFVGTEEAELIDGICDHLGRSKDTEDNLRISHVDGRMRMNRERKYEMYHAKNSSAAVKNQRATQLLRSDVFGPAIIVQQTTEHGRLTPRLCSYTLAEFDNVFARKKKASAPASGDAGPVALTNEEFKKMKVEMQQDASSVEAKFSAQAVPPQQLARSKPLPLKSGQQLAKEYPPPEPAVPPPVARQNASCA